MKKVFSIVDLIVLLIILLIIFLVAKIIIGGVLNNIKKDTNKILIDNYANSVIYAKELFMKNNDNNLPKYCSIDNNIIYYDENYNNKYDSNELLCNKECENDNCIKYYITSEDIKNKSVKCNKIIISEDNFEISNCYIGKKMINNYKYKLKE